MEDAKILEELKSVNKEGGKLEKEKYFPVLFNILSSEQQISQRTDQKAFTLLSILGVFAIFFMGNYTKIPLTTFNLTFVFFYFFAVLTAIFNLLLVISPRIRDSESKLQSENIIIPTYFGGIVKFKDHQQYGEHLHQVLSSVETTFEVFVSSIYSVGTINSYKNKFLKRGIIFFIVAVTSEIVIVIALYYYLFIENLKS